MPRRGPTCPPGRARQTCGWALLTPVSSPAGPGEAVPEGFQRGCVLRGWRGLLPVQRVCALPGGASAAAHPHHCPDKAGAPGLGPASVPSRSPVALGTAQGPGNSAGEFCLRLLISLRETEGRAGGSESSPGSPRAPGVMQQNVGRWRHAYRRIVDVTQRCLSGNSATGFPGPLGSPAWRGDLQGPGACRGGVGTGLPSPLQRSCSSFSTRGRLQWVSLHQRWLIFLQYLKQT